jgi:hypothetical protein
MSIRIDISSEVQLIEISEVNMDIPNRPMTDEEAKEEIRKMGGYAEYRRQSTGVDSDIDYRLMSHECEYELKKNYNGDAAALFRDRPDLYNEYRRSMWIKTGAKVKD